MPDMYDRIVARYRTQLQSLVPVIQIPIQTWLTQRNKCRHSFEDVSFMPALFTSGLRASQVSRGLSRSWPISAMGRLLGKRPEKPVTDNPVSQALSGLGPPCFL
jgi:hypothetical protein